MNEKSGINPDLITIDVERSDLPDDIELKMNELMSRIDKMGDIMDSIIADGGDGKNMKMGFYICMRYLVAIIGDMALAKYVKKEEK